MSNLVGDYRYEFPAGAVAQVPAARRDGARLFLVERFACEGSPARPAIAGLTTVGDLPGQLARGDLIVLNDVAVLPARLSARRATGGLVSVLVLDSRGAEATVLLGARGSLGSGEVLDVHGDRWSIRRDAGEGRFEIEVLDGRPVEELMAAVGRMPLPPYIDRGALSDPRDDLDRERYRSTFAAGGAAVAAPTAGLHFTQDLLARCEAAGVRVACLRLDVGEGTFRPLRGERLDDHRMHAERFEVPQACADAFAETRAAGGRVLAVGTTVVRALESAVEPDGRGLRAGAGETDLFIRPGHAFGAVDGLLTNFHQPGSTLLVLVSAFAGLATVRRAYAEAIAAGCRLFSYGDAMLMTGPGPASDPTTRNPTHPGPPTPPGGRG